MNETLKNIKVGEYIYCKPYLGRIDLYKVLRETPTLIICENKRRFNKKTCLLVGTTDWDRAWGRPITKKLMEEYKLQQIKRNITNINGNKLRKDINEHEIVVLENLLKEINKYMEVFNGSNKCSD